MKERSRQNFWGAVGAAALVVLFCFLLLWRDPLVFWNDDFELSILPVCADMARAWNHGEFPLLTESSWVCGNLAGEYQYGVFSVFINALIVAIWKLPLIFSQQAAALSIAHLSVLAGGAFLLACNRALSVANATLVAVVAALNGWMICWGATDWLGALGAFAWLPWAWWASERALDASRTRWRFIWPAPFAYFLFTGGFPYTALMLALVVAWLMARSWEKERSFGQLLPLVGGLALGLGLASPAFLALFSYVGGSARGVQDPSSHFQWLVPWRSWPGLFLPSWTVNWSDFSSRATAHGSTELACGLVPIAALAAGLIRERSRLVRKIRWELILLGILLVACMLPTAGMFRWSFRWLPLFHLVLALCAAEALQDATSQGLRLKSSLVALIGLIIVSVLSLVFRFQGDDAYPLTWILLGLAAIWVALDFLPPRLNWVPVGICFAAFLATYWCIAPNCGVPKYNLSQSLLRAAPLDPDRLYLSLYPPPETFYRVEVQPHPVGELLRLGSSSLWSGLRFVNGYSPIRPAGVARDFATGIHGEIDQGMAQWLVESEAGAGGLLDRLGIDAIIIARAWDFAPKPANEWAAALPSGEGKVFYRERGPIPLVRALDPGSATISNIRSSRNRVSIEVATEARPATLTFSRPFFPGYVARINGRPLPVTTVRNLTPLVEIPPRTHGIVTLVYRPAWFLVGGAIAAISAGIWLISALFALRTRA